MTGDYGNMLPIDWEQISTKIDSAFEDENTLLENLVAQNEPEKTSKVNATGSLMEAYDPHRIADQVLEEIDTMLYSRMSSTSSSACSSGMTIDATSCASSCSTNITASASHQQQHYIKKTNFFNFSLEKLKSLNVDQLTDLHEDLELKVEFYSQSLVEILSRRDEQEYEKEIKNSLLTQLVLVQNKIKKHTKCRIKCGSNMPPSLGQCRAHKHLATVIPYSRDHVLAETSQCVPVMQSLVKSKYSKTYLLSLITVVQF